MDSREIDREILGFKLYLTCGACPEQYDVEKDGKPAGYLRLRHGTFTAEYPGPLGVLVYSAKPDGDGIFDADEREYYLTKAIIAIKEYLGLVAHIESMEVN